MKSADQKKLLEDLKRQITNLNYYLKTVKVIPKDRKSVSSFENALISAENLNRALTDGLWKLEKEVREERISKTDRDYKQVLASINSPTEAMIKSSEANMAVKTGSTNGSNIVKNAVEFMNKKAVENGSELRKKANRKD